MADVGYLLVLRELRLGANEATTAPGEYKQRSNTFYWWTSQIEISAIAWHLAGFQGNCRL